jgi:hypothetical protein
VVEREVSSCVSSMTPRKTTRNTRHAIALSSAKQGLTSAHNSTGMVSQRMRTEARMATPMVMLAYRLDQQIYATKKLTNNKLVRFVIEPWINNVGHRQ